MHLQYIIKVANSANIINCKETSFVFLAERSRKIGFRKRFERWRFYDWQIKYKSLIFTNHQNWRGQNQELALNNLYPRMLLARRLKKTLSLALSHSSRCYKLNNPSSFLFSASAQPQKQRTWHIVGKESILNHLEIYYNTSQFSARDQQLKKEQAKVKLFNNKHKMLNKLQQYTDFITTNRMEINKYLQQINLNSDLILLSLADLSRSLKDFTKELDNDCGAKLFSKNSVVQFVLNEVLADKPHQSLFKKLAEILQAEIRLKSTFTYFDQFASEKPTVINSHPSMYPEVWDNVQVQTFDSDHKIDKKYEDISAVLHATNGAITASEKASNSVLEKIFFGMILPVNFIKYEWGLLNSLSLYRKANLESYRKFLNLYEQGFFKLFTSFYYFPNIATNKMMYIPPEGEFTQNLDIFKENKDYISVRILHHKELPLINSSQGKQEEIQDIIVHMHGGGFVGLSSHTTQNYTRPWANQLKMPVFSIDYRMPPSHPFPHAPNDCFQVYKFLVNHLHKYMRIRPKNIYVCGDSAGGNLSCSLTALTMKNNILKPKALFLAYPCVDTRMIYYPSRKFVINDPLIWPSIGQMFFNAYTNQSQRNDPIASPLLLTEEYLGGEKGDSRFPSKWPMTYITMGNKDFLRDQCFLFMQRMIESNVPCKMYLFQHLRHAFLSTERLMKQSNDAFMHSIDAFKQLVKRSKEEQI